jgi:4-hydroxythreonine-4-phosphate dehydrogenase
MASDIRLLITTGDTDGIGWEVTAKALHAIGPKPGFQFFFYRHLKSSQDKPVLSRRFKHQVVSSLAQASEVFFNPKVAIEIRSSKSPAFWVEEAALACRDKKFSGLITAPLSKTSIIDAGLKDIGHTEILSRVCAVRDLFMGFMGKKFCVVLMTGHEPLVSAATSFSATKLTKAIQAARSLRSLLPAAKSKLPLAVVGLNPHAGERGLLGREEAWMKALLEDLNSEADAIAGPLVPDAAFLPQNWKSYSVYLCPYHDQGLIPFKMVHGFQGGVHLTLGLPFVRTSVDHGTAKELYGKNKAEAGSMKDAIQTAMRLCKSGKDLYSAAQSSGEPL